MTANEIRLFREAAQVLLTLLRCVAMKRSLDIGANEHLNFFRLYDSCLMDVAVISWCKVLGSEREKLNWKKLFPESATNARMELKKSLDAITGDLDALTGEIRKYRDTYVAHHDTDETKRALSHPSLDPLQLIGFAIYRHIYSALADVNRAQKLPFPESISDLSLEKIETHWREIASAAKLATQHFSDTP